MYHFLATFWAACLHMNFIKIRNIVVYYLVFSEPIKSHFTFKSNVEGLGE
jgi:hypothetical protein